MFLVGKALQELVLKFASLCAVFSKLDKTNSEVFMNKLAVCE
jgi:hypothetical protein